MTLPVFPGPRLLAGLGYSSKWSPRFFTQSAATATGASIDVSLASTPLHQFELTYRFLRDGPRWGGALAGLEFRTMMGFHLQLAGTAGRFLYRNPDDWRVFRDQIATGDGTTKTFTLTRAFGANGFLGVEPIGQVNAGEPFDVYVGDGGSPALPSSYVLDTSTPLRNTVTFAVAPAAGQAIAVDMAYLYYCRLADDVNTFEKFMEAAWSLGKVTLMSCRAGA